MPFDKPLMPSVPPVRPETPKSGSLSPISLPRKQKPPENNNIKAQPPKKEFSRPEVRGKFKRVENTNQIKMLREERVRIEKELFPYKDYGSDISEKDINKRISLLKKERFRTPHTADKIKIEHQINLLKKIKGEKPK